MDQLVFNQLIYLKFKIKNPSSRKKTHTIFMKEEIDDQSTLPSRGKQIALERPLRIFCPATPPSPSTTPTNCEKRKLDEIHNEEDGNKSNSDYVSSHDYESGKSLGNKETMVLLRKQNSPCDIKWESMYYPVCKSWFNKDTSAAKNILLLGICQFIKPKK
ncbi:hypothetical protein DFA_09358 [Cavenderia fasciculata]|uniref:Uncharacterized protein n=1 Tax=Cavenderia fasciculata TaxID=261658 RepID=F4Q7E6_CACFS|nr:uncharacterized protein DFA_09358 [Cavenderia fasciculata]EGG16328.1 hypothetical protein DFA_09358 [Cavenderia fasciculata]|eukprot:XP_004354712.1 hypothetical protein DFA_09358 [Cavenderia fasciculata]